MQYLSGFLIAAFGKLFEFIAAHISKKIAMGGAIIGTSLALLTAFWIALKALVVGLMSQVTNQHVLMGVLCALAVECGTVPVGLLDGSACSLYLP